MVQNDETGGLSGVLSVEIVRFVLSLLEDRDLQNRWENGGRENRRLDDMRGSVHGSRRRNY